MNYYGLELNEWSDIKDWHKQSQSFIYGLNKSVMNSYTLCLLLRHISMNCDEEGWAPTSVSFLQKKLMRGKNQQNNILRQLKIAGVILKYNGAKFKQQRYTKIDMETFKKFSTTCEENAKNYALDLGHNKLTSKGKNLALLQAQESVPKRKTKLKTRLLKRDVAPCGQRRLSSSFGMTLSKRLHTAIITNGISNGKYQQTKWAEEFDILNKKGKNKKKDIANVLNWYISNLKNKDADYSIEAFCATSFREKYAKIKIKYLKSIKTENNNKPLPKSDKELDPNSKEFEEYHKAKGDWSIYKPSTSEEAEAFYSNH